MATILPRIDGARPHNSSANAAALQNGKGPNGEQTPQKPDIYNDGAEGIPYWTPAQKPPAGTAINPRPDNKPIPKLFTPLKIRGVEFQNRIWVSPMCQYSAHEGFHTPWHTAHLGGMLLRGPGLTLIEATAVQARGRITPEDSGIWLDAHIPALQQHVQFAHSQGQKIGIQLAHAGRKASTVAPWLSMGKVALTATKAVSGWPDDCVAPSAIAGSPDFPVPREISLQEIEELKEDWVSATKRAVAAGFDVVEIHAAHGYLLHSFLSPATNHRGDGYGGSFENRVRLLVEIVDLVRGSMPETMPLFVRISATDWLEEVEGFGKEGSWTGEDSVSLAGILADKGVDLLDVSTGGNHMQQKIKPKGQAYQAEFAQRIKEVVGGRLLVSTVGGITTGTLAEELVQGKEGGEVGLDAVMAGHAFLKNPGVVWTWAEELGTGIYVSNQIGWGFGGTAQPPAK